MTNQSPASKFIEESVNHPEWLKTIETGPTQAILNLANEKGFDVSWDELKTAAKELLSGNQPADATREPSKEVIDEAASGMSDFQNDTGYGDDTGYAALYGVAGMILKLEEH